jgi:hypothetical protein
MSSSTIPVIPEPAVVPEDIVRQLRAIADQIRQPGVVPGTAAVRRRLAHVTPELILAAVNAAGASNAVQASLRRTDQDMRQELDTMSRWSAVIDELRSLLQLAFDINTTRRQRIGLAALQTYHICKQLVRDEGHAVLATHIAEMKRVSKFGRPRRKVEAQPDQEPPPPLPAVTKK